MKKEGTQLFTIEKNVKCIECGSKGAVQYFGNYNNNKEEKSRISFAVGFGGTVPYECLNCGNKGLIDMDGLEGYKVAFRSIFEEI